MNAAQLKTLKRKNKNNEKRHSLLLKAGVNALKKKGSASSRAFGGAAAEQQQQQQQEQVNSSLASVFLEANVEEAGKKVLSYFIFPNTVEEFFERIYEKETLLIKRNKTNGKYFDGILSSHQIKSWLKSGFLSVDDFTVTKYVDFQKKSKTNLSSPSDALLHLENGWSIRLLRPQTQVETIWKICALLESFWKCSSGCNAYLTPSSTQGFAPHYDDVDVFILQVEGCKRWKVYKNKERGERQDEMILFPKLPRFSSKDFSPEEVESELTIVHDVVLKPGDFLYLPRGVVHQAECVEGPASLHLTFSQATQKATYGELIGRAIRRTLENAQVEECILQTKLRNALPRNYDRYLGVIHSSLEEEDNPKKEKGVISTTSARASIRRECVALIEQEIIPFLDFDYAADELFSDFLHDRHLPCFENEGEGDDGVVELSSVMKINVQNSCRLCVEGDVAIVRHCMKNTKTYHEVEPRGIEFDREDAEIIDAILTMGDKTFAVSELPEREEGEGVEGEEDDRIRICKVMLSENVLSKVNYN